MFVDSDDYLHPRTVELCVREMERSNADLVEFGYLITSETEPNYFSIADDYPTCVLERTSDPNSIIHLEKRTDHISCNKLYRLDIIRENGMNFRRRRFEDTKFTREYLLHIRRAVLISLYMQWTGVKKLLEQLYTFDRQLCLTALHGVNGSEIPQDYSSGNSGYLIIWCGKIIRQYCGSIITQHSGLDSSQKNLT